MEAHLREEYLAFAEGQRVAMGVSDEAGLLKALQEACAEIEKASGKTLMTNDAAGMKQLYGKVEGTIAGMGLDGDVATSPWWTRRSTRWQARQGARHPQVTFETETRDGGSDEMML